MLGLRKTEPLSLIILVNVNISPLSFALQGEGGLCHKVTLTITSRCETSFCYRGNSEGVFETTLTYLQVNWQGIIDKEGKKLWINLHLNGLRDIRC